MDVNLVLFKKNGTQKGFALPSQVTVIGRRRDCDLYIPLMAVSRKHCQLIQNQDSLKVRDLGSRNGTYLNGERVEEATAKPGDYVQIGPLTFLIQIDGKPQKIAPPTPDQEKQPTPKKAAAPQKKPASKQKQPAGALADDDVLADLDADASDSFAAELKNL
jgi:pSer/pThr/pTyr-binding forkhead associated (FHA) protein